MRAPVVAVALGLAMVATTVAEGEPCYSSSNPELDTGFVGGSRHYYDLDPCLPPEDGCRPRGWLYEEANGIEGLQRDDEAHTDLYYCRAAGITVQPDRVITDT